MGTTNFSELDLPNIRKRYFKDNNPKQFLFYLDNVKCGKCISKIKKELSPFNELKSISINLGTHVATIDIEEDGLIGPIAQKLSDIGFFPRPIRGYSEVSFARESEQKRMLNRLAITGVFAGNIMMFAFANYMGATGSWEIFFNFLSGGLFFGVLVFGCSPFFKASKEALLSGRASIDIPIATSLLIGAGVSYYHLLEGRGDIYFDSLAMLVFLILASRFSLFMFQKNLLSPSFLKEYFKIDTAIKVTPSGEISVSPTDLALGETLRVNERGVFPVDCEYLGNEAIWVETSILTGEFLPSRINPGETCFAGTQLLSKSTIFRVLSSVELSKVGRLIAQVENQLLQKTPLTSLADRIAQYFTVGILTLGTIFFIYYVRVDFQEAFNRALALVILACPCALAFATPLGQCIALSKLARAGILIQKGEALERLTRVKNIIFDKTGTLSEGRLRFLGWANGDPSFILKSIIFALEKHSKHPVGRSLKAEVSKWENSNIVISDIKEVVGEGVFGKFEGRNYSIRAVPSAEEGKMAVGVFADDQCLATAFFGDVSKFDSKETIWQLNNMGYNCYLISGDQAVSVNVFARNIGFRPENVFSEMSPDKKLEFIKKHPDSLMVGDGANDLLALAESSVSAAVKGSLEVSLKLSDVYFGKSGVLGVVELLRVSKEAMFVIKRSLFISLVYNIIGASAALLGFVSPLVAAVLMPLSSLVVVGLTVYGTGFLRSFSKNLDLKNRHFIDERGGV